MGLRAQRENEVDRKIRAAVLFSFRKALLVRRHVADDHAASATLALPISWNFSVTLLDLRNLLGAIVLRFCIPSFPAFLESLHLISFLMRAACVPFFYLLIYLPL